MYIHTFKCRQGDELHEWAQDVNRIKGNDEIIQIPNLFLSGKAAKTKFGSSLHSDPRRAIFGRADIGPIFQVQPSLQNPFKAAP